MTCKDLISSCCLDNETSGMQACRAIPSGDTDKLNIPVAGGSAIISTPVFEHNLDICDVETEAGDNSGSTRIEEAFDEINRSISEDDFVIPLPHMINGGGHDKLCIEEITNDAVVANFPRAHDRDSHEPGDLLSALEYQVQNMNKAVSNGCFH